MHVLLTRGSVAPGDDADAPHARRLELAVGATLRDLGQWLLANPYLPLVPGGSTWAIRLRQGAGAHGGAAVAVLTHRPPALFYARDPFLRLTDGAHAHLDYLQHQDPDATVALIRRDPARSSLRLG